VVSVLNAITLGKDSLANKVKVLDLCREPWHCFRAKLGNVHSLGPELIEAFLDIAVFEVTDEINMESHSLLAGGSLWRF